MFSEIAFVFCALLAIEASLGYALPAGKKTIPELESIDEPNEPEIQENDEEEEESYQIVLKSPSQSMKVRLVMDNKRRHEDNKVHRADNNQKYLEQATDKMKGTMLKKVDEVQNVSDEVEIQTEDFSENAGKKRRKMVSDEETGFQEDDDILTTSYKCNWRHLYSLYMKKKQSLLGDKFFYPKERRKQFQKSFKIICDNPEETIAELLELDE